MISAIISIILLIFSLLFFKIIHDIEKVSKAKLRMEWVDILLRMQAIQDLSDKLYGENKDKDEDHIRKLREEYDDDGI